jgi:two-component system, sensor histidine kinase and response regulator
MRIWHYQTLCRINCTTLDSELPDMEGYLFREIIKNNALVQDTLIVLLSSYGMRGEAAHTRMFDFSAYLSKPVKSPQLQNCLTMGTGGRQLKSTGPPGQFITRHLVKEEVRRRTRILVAEATMVNQKQLIRDRERLTDKHLPIIALTAHSLAGDKEHFPASGLDDYMAKPLKIDALVSAVDRWLGKQQVV